MHFFRELLARFRHSFAWTAILALASVPLAVSLMSQAKVKTVSDRVQEFGEVVDARLAPLFRAAGVAYPPPALLLVGLKHERELQIYAKNEAGKFKFVHRYPVLAASGQAGPKLRQGDYQVPEGFYKIHLLNPNSRFHLSLRVNYPNAFDQEKAELEGRTDLGGDIMIHGSNVSVGCLAMGDPAAEDLFVLAARTGLPKIEVLLVPHDFRNRALAEAKPPTLTPAWTSELWKRLAGRLEALPAPP
jgi:hypothetical protein